MNNDEQLKAIAAKVLNKAGVPQEENFGSVIAILMMISIILTVIRVLQECNKNKLSGNYTSQDKYNLYGSEIKEYSARRGLFTQMRIKRILRRELPKEQYAKYGIQLLNAILDTGADLKDDEVITLVEAANV
jgi:hypothetical protein